MFHTCVIVILPTPGQARAFRMDTLIKLLGLLEPEEEFNQAGLLGKRITRAYYHRLPVGL